MSQSFIKDKDAVLDYQISWGTWLDGDTIVSHAVTVTPANGLTIDSSDITGSGMSVTVWLSGGTVGPPYRVTNHIVTAAGREDDRTITVRVRDR